MPCQNCLLARHCRKRRFLLLTTSDLTNPNTLRDARNTGHRYFMRNGVSETEAPEFLLDAYSDYDHALQTERILAQAVSGAWIPTMLATNALLIPDDVIDANGVKEWKEKMRNYFRRNWFQTVPYVVTPRSPRSPELFLQVANLVGLLNIHESRYWNRNWAHNDNWPLLRPDNDN